VKAKYIYSIHSGLPPRIVRYVPSNRGIRLSNQTVIITTRVPARRGKQGYTRSDSQRETYILQVWAKVAAYTDYIRMHHVIISTRIVMHAALWTHACRQLSR